MKIAVVSTGRSRCTLLAKYLHATNPELEFCGEFYNAWRDKDGNVEDPGSRILNPDIGGDPNQQIQSIDNLTDELFAKENYIVKIMAISLKGFKDLDPAVYRLEEYDQIHLIERHDFFEQCCSWEIALSTGMFHLTPDTMPDHPERKKRFEALKKRKFKIVAERITWVIKTIELYLKIKQYVIDNNLAYTLHTYESAKQFDDKQDELVASELNYSELISNYHLKEQVNTVFNKYISYDGMTIDVPSFYREIRDIAELRFKYESRIVPSGHHAIKSFANVMADNWRNKKFSMVARTGSDPASLP